MFRLHFIITGVIHFKIEGFLNVLFLKLACLTPSLYYSQMLSHSLDPSSLCSHLFVVALAEQIIIH